MKLPKHIRFFAAGLLLLLLAIGMTPGSFFHDLIANHRDDAGCTHRDRACVHQQQQRCHFLDWVVNAPYVPASSPIEIAGLPLPEAENCIWAAGPLPAYFSHSGSRGPPSATAL